MLAQAADQVDVAPRGLLMLALAAEQVEAAQADLVSIGSAFAQAPDVEAAQEDEDKENKPPATPAARGPKWLRDPQAGPLRVCFMPILQLYMRT